MSWIEVVDSHTAGEPTRVIVSGGPDLGIGPLSDRVHTWRSHYDQFRSAVVHEPRGSDVLVGALLCKPVDPSCAAGVIFFNNAGFLNMCGHGAIGVVETLKYLGRIQPGTIQLETPVGVVSATLDANGAISIQNVPSYRQAANFTVELPDFGRLTGDIAWGGNWFYLVHSGVSTSLNLANVGELTELSWQLRHAVNNAGFSDVDHIELFGPPTDSSAHSRNFVLCPGKAYDRSPCGTGTSAKLACLAADEKLQPGEVWVQESILGTRFEGRYFWHDEARKIITPTITGRAYVTAESRLRIDDSDPFAWGIRG